MNWIFDADIDRWEQGLQTTRLTSDWEFRPSHMESNSPMLLVTLTKDRKVIDRYTIIPIVIPTRYKSNLYEVLRFSDSKFWDRATWRKVLEILKGESSRAVELEMSDSLDLITVDLYSVKPTFGEITPDDVQRALNGESYWRVNAEKMQKLYKLVKDGVSLDPILIDKERKIWDGHHRVGLYKYLVEREGLEGYRIILAQVVLIGGQNSVNGEENEIYGSLPMPKSVIPDIFKRSGGMSEGLFGGTEIPEPSDIDADITDFDFKQIVDRSPPRARRDEDRDAVQEAMDEYGGFASATNRRK